MKRIEVSQYMQGTRQKTTMQGEVAGSLSQFERKLAETLKRVEINGKRGRCVPVLLTDKHYTQIEALLRTRNSVEINRENIYVFARFGEAKFPLRSSDVLRKFASECGAQQPDLITSTSLRKHVATVSQILNLKNNELDSLANFLGHDIRVHREYYRLPDDTIQLAKVSKLLLEMESGTLQTSKGKSLDEIQIDAEETLHMDYENDEQPAVFEKEATCEAKCKKRKVERRMWTEEERRAVEKHLGKYLVSSKLPGKAECLEAMKKAPILSRRPWEQIKFFIKNHKAV